MHSAVEHVFAGQEHRMGLVVRTIGIADLAYNLKRVTWLEKEECPADTKPPEAEPEPPE